MAPGPTFWVTPDVLKNWQLFDLSAELKDMAAVSVAAKSRIFRQEDFRNGGLRIRARSQRLDRLLATSTVQHIAWCHTWIPNSFLFYVNDAEKQVEHTITTRRTANDIPPRLQAWEARNQREGDDVEADEESDESSTVRVQTPTEARRSWQLVAMQLMRQPTLQQTRIHLRRRLDTWDLHTLEGHRVDRAVSIFRRASNLVPPRVVAAYLRTICGGWMTSARFGQLATPCRFGCVHGTDSLSPIARCPVAHSLIESEARLHYPTGGWQADFCWCITEGCLSDSWLKFRTEDLSEVFRRRLLAIYALYRLHNGLRYQKHSVDDIAGASRGYFRGDSSCRSIDD